MNDLTIAPQKHDHDLTTEVLRDLVAVLVRHSCAIVHKAGMTVLVEIQPGHTLRALADIREVSPYLIEMRRFGEQPLVEWEKTQQ